MKSYHDILGDGGSDIVAQVTEQRSRLLAALAGVRHLVAVGSGKGGVGKSTLTFWLASALRGLGHRVAILDADVNGPSQARLAGLGAAPLVPGPDGALAMPRNADGIGVVSLGTLVPEAEAVEFDTVVQGNSHVWRATREFAFLGQLMGNVRWGELEFLLVDLPPGAERTFQYAEFLGAGAAFVLVTIPSELARSAVSRSIAALNKTPNRLLGYVENMSGYYCAECADVRPLFAPGSEPDFGIPCLGRVPFDPALEQPGRVGSAALESLSAIAARVAAASTHEEKEVEP